MRSELEIYEKLKNLVIEYLCIYLKYEKCEKIKLLTVEIKTLCWTLNKMGLYEELPKNRVELLTLQKQLKHHYKNQ